MALGQMENRFTLDRCIIHGRISEIRGNMAIVRRGDSVEQYNLKYYRIVEV